MDEATRTSLRRLVRDKQLLRSRLERVERKLTVMTQERDRLVERLAMYDPVEEAAGLEKGRVGAGRDDDYKRR